MCCLLVKSIADPEVTPMTVMVVLKPDLIPVPLTLVRQKTTTDSDLTAVWYVVTTDPNLIPVPVVRIWSDDLH